MPLSNPPLPGRTPWPCPGLPARYGAQLQSQELNHFAGLRADYEVAHWLEHWREVAEVTAAHEQDPRCGCGEGARVTGTLVPPAVSVAGPDVRLVLFCHGRTRTAVMF